ncbi:MAG: hypothetical protein JNL32_03470 [Candidatus Kapabacteria bacterium]|nr:hypothetical protein [Candidatus Kapabacteria bacterium]
MPAYYKEYRYSNVRRVIYSIISTALIGTGMWLINYPFKEWKGNDDILSFILFVMLGITSIALGTATILSIIYAKVVINNSSISTWWSYLHHSFDITDVRSYTYKKSLIRITYQGSTGQERTTVISADLKDSIEILTWLEEHGIPDKDILDQQENDTELYSDPVSDEMTDRRMEEIQFVRRWTYVLNTFYALLAILVLFYPKPYEFLMVTLVISPLPAIILLLRYPTIVRIAVDDNFSNPHLIGLFFSSCIFMIAMITNDVLDQSKLFLYSILTMATLVLITHFKMFERISDWKKLGSPVGIACFTFFTYCMGACTFINIYYDSSIPTTYSTPILSKRSAGSSNTKYYITVSRYEESLPYEDLEVGESFYEKKKSGDSVDMVIHKGVLGIRWMRIE